MMDGDDAGDDVLTGRLLVANPRLLHPTFRRTVILLATHDDEGAMGVILNRPLGKEMGSLMSDWQESVLRSVPLFEGGPVEPKQLILCGWKELSGEPEFQFAFGIAPERAEAMVGKRGERVRAFFGYAGWSAGQLEDELKEGAWAVLALTPGFLNRDMNVDLWRGIAEDFGGDWRLAASEPEDVGLN